MKKWYLVTTFVLSIYVIVITILGFTSISKSIMAPLNQIAYYILWFFIIELIVLFIKTRNIRTFLKEQWLGIIAVGSSVSVTVFVDAIVGLGSLTGLKSLKGAKSLKALKSIKAFKATKSVKVAKSYKIGKKASKAVQAVEDSKHIGLEK
jgi:hypothetical protein